jgi:hypothetical protein
VLSLGESSFRLPLHRPWTPRASSAAPPVHYCKRKQSNSTLYNLESTSANLASHSPLRAPRTLALPPFRGSFSTCCDGRRWRDVEVLNVRLLPLWTRRVRWGCRLWWRCVFLLLDEVGFLSLLRFNKPRWAHTLQLKRSVYSM